MTRAKPHAEGNEVREPWQATAPTRQGQPAVAADGLAVPVRPALAPNVQLVGEMQDTGFKDRQWLIQRDGQFIQLTELLYRVAEQADGERTVEVMAAGVTTATDWVVSADNVRQILQTKLIPMGLIATTDGSATAPAGVGSKTGGRSPLALNMRTKVISPSVIEPITNVLQILYAPPVLIPLLALIVIAHGWLYLVHGVLRAILEVLYRPGLLLVVLAIMLLAGIVHEFGHAAALRYGGGKVRGMGAGLYLIYPAFYTDVTDSYQLGRWARVRTDVGGFYFHLLFALGIIALALASGQEFLLFVVVLINLNIILQNLPFVRLDGYWTLADLTGIPDFFSQMGPFLRSVLPLPRWKGAKLPHLKPWVKAVFASYIIVTVPLLAFLLFQMVTNVPRLVATTWGSLLLQTERFADARRDGQPLELAVSAVQMLLLLLPLGGTAYLLFRLIRRLIRAAWNWSRPAPLRQAAVSVVAAGTVAFLLFTWTPQVSSITQAAPVGVQSFEISERNHVDTPVDYARTPPVGGNHAPIWQNCGFYSMPVASENAVHSLEHGAVWITYRPDLSPQQLAAVRRQVRDWGYVLASPFPGQSAPVIASAWGHQLQLDSPDDPRLSQFVRAFRLGDQAPERGGGCTGGIGAPE